MHAPYILLKSYKDPIKDNINTDSYVSNYHFGIFYIMILKLILFFYIFAVIEGEYSIRNKGPHNSFQSLSLIFCLRNIYVPCNIYNNFDPFEMLASDFCQISNIRYHKRCFSPKSPNLGVLNHDVNILEFFDQPICSAFGLGPYSALMKRVQTIYPKMKIQARAIPYMFDAEEDW